MSLSPEGKGDSGDDRENAFAGSTQREIANSLGRSTSRVENRVAERRARGEGLAAA
jgi:hypothetical protein